MQAMRAVRRTRARQQGRAPSLSAARCTARRRRASWRAPAGPACTTCVAGTQLQASLCAAAYACAPGARRLAQALALEVWQGCHLSGQGTHAFCHLVQRSHWLGLLPC
jgi:hypothetical protein